MKLALIITQIILFEIWQSRKNNRYDEKLIPQHVIINKVNSQLQTILQTRYKKQTKRHTKPIERAALHK